MRRLPWSLWLWLSLLTPAGAVAQETTGQDLEGTYAETVDVNVINVEVFVTDKKGNPITGFEKEDFELLEDGRPVTITNFYAVESGRPATPVETSPLEIQRPGSLELLPIPEDQRLHVVVYVDNFNIRPLNRNRVFSQLREFLVTQLEPSDRVMLVSYDRSLHIRHPFTNEASRIAATLHELEKDTGHALQRDNERKRIRSFIEKADQIGEAAARVRQYAASLDNDLRFTLDALRDMVKSLSGLPGRKALLYVSDGLPMIPGHELFWAVERRFDDISVLAESRYYDASGKFGELAAEANADRVTFYTVDASGLQAYTSGQAETGRTSGTDTLNLFVDQVASDNLQASIQYLAERTGGRAIVNANDISAGLDRVADDLGTYYSLGFVSAHQGDGRYHTIEVRLKEKDKAKGHIVRHREGYRDKPVWTRMTEGTLSSLRYRYERNPLDIDLDLGASRRHDQGDFEVPILVRIPLGKVVLIPRGELYRASLRVFFSAMDEKGGISDVQQAAVPIEIPPEELETARQKYYTYEVRLLMRAGQHRVAVGVRDEIGAEISFVTRQVQVGGQARLPDASGVAPSTERVTAQKSSVEAP
jgi:VWFA-related protein